jgi:hypothetical protein
MREQVLCMRCQGDCACFKQGVLRWQVLLLSSADGPQIISPGVAMSGKVCAVLVQRCDKSPGVSECCLNSTAGSGDHVPVPFHVESCSDCNQLAFIAVCPCSYVFPVDLGNGPLRVWSAASHEIGHTFGLYHDMLVNTLTGCYEYPNQTNYYDGQYNNYCWAPIMGEWWQPQTLRPRMYCDVKASACKE